MRSVIENMEDGVERVWDRHGQVRTGGRALVACSLDCAKVLREIARIQRQHDYVLLASHDRLLPDGEFYDIPENSFFSQKSLHATPPDTEIAGSTTCEQSRARGFGCGGVRKDIHDLQQCSKPVLHSLAQ